MVAANVVTSLILFHNLILIQIAAAYGRPGFSKMNTGSSDNTGLARKVTAVGTVGQANQLFTVYEKNWNCPACSQENYASRPTCSRCKKKKPTELKDNFVANPALAALKEGKEVIWQEVVDPASYQIYYYNKETGETQWERPLEMGPAPLATGWFGRGLAGSKAHQIFAELNSFYLTRPARKQKDFVDPKKYHLEGANEYNIWYGKFMGDYNNKSDREAAGDRCVLNTDAGATKADLMNKDLRHKRYFCVHFAHGMCAKGSDCIFYHRVPTPEDDVKCDELMDCFGRQRHSKHKDDMSGVGSFMKPCRTLFVGNLLKTKYDSPKALEDAVWKHFGEWGELESCNVIHRLSIAFPRYRLRTSAEFAREAMAGQSLDKGEILSIRWAFDDPNPVAQDAVDRADKDALAALLQAKGLCLKPAGFEYPPEYQLPEAKRLRLDEGGDILQQHPELAYPDTDSQYMEYYQQMVQFQLQQQQQMAASAVVAAAPFVPSTTPADSTAADVSVGANVSESYYAKQAALARLGIYADDDVEEPTVVTAEAGNEKLAGEKEEAEDDEEEEEGWQQFKDESSGAFYYFNRSTGESSWQNPIAESTLTAATVDS